MNEYIASQLKAHNLNQYDVSIACGWSRTALYQIIHGNSTVNPMQAVTLEEVTKGAIEADKASDGFFKRLRNLGFTRSPCSQSIISENLSTDSLGRQAE